MRQDCNSLKFAFFAAVAVFFVASSPGFADIRGGLYAETFDAGPFQRPSSPPGREGATHATDVDHDSPLLAEFADILPVAALGGVAGSQPSSETPHQSQVVRQLPPGPSSISLFFTAIGGLGACRFGRSAKKFRFGSLPDWYHTGDPIQIGHASVIGLNGQIPAPHYDQPPGDDDSAHPSFRYALHPLGRLRAQCFGIAVDVRGPPLFHL
jgi:hypothetical protein